MLLLRSSFTFIYNCTIQLFSFNYTIKFIYLEKCKHYGERAFNSESHTCELLSVVQMD